MDGKTSYASRITSPFAGSVRGAIHAMEPGKAPFGPNAVDAEFAPGYRADQFSVGFTIRSITKFGTNSCTASSLSPSWS